jgi:hypothetical protein
MLGVGVPITVGSCSHALAVFGAPNNLADHADAAVRAAVLIHRLVAERFGGALRIGIEINTGVVIAGTLGGGGKLEFTLIGDTVNVAARVEQLTKTTGDAILLTGQTVDSLDCRPPGLTDRGSHELKGKSAAIQVFGTHGPRPRPDLSCGSITRASFTLRAEGAAVFHLQFVHGATAAPCSVSTRPIDATRNPQARIWSTSPQISGVASRVPGRAESRVRPASGQRSRGGVPTRELDGKRE